MHDSSYETMRAFARVHLEAYRGQPLDIVDFGSQVVEQQTVSYRNLLDDPAWTYRGLDIEAGRNVDVVVDDAYDWTSIDSDSVDLVVSGQAFEHVQYFWASMFEIVRILKPGGLAAIIAPSSGFEHRYPVDCWRFYRDGFDALAGYVGCETVDVFTDWDHPDWSDSILVASKPDWDDDGRRRFARRAAMQRSLLSSGGDIPNEPDLGPRRAVSPLQGVTPGALTAELAAMRSARLDREVEAAAARRFADEAERRAEIEAQTAIQAERLAAERLQGITPLRLYSAGRRAAARLAGDRGRATYKRLRGRS